MDRSLRKRIIWLLGTLLIGALGSGVWELLRPGFVWFGVAMLDIATLGLQTLRDGIYFDAAKGNKERASLLLLMLMSGVLIGIAGATFTLRNYEKSSSQITKNTIGIFRTNIMSWIVVIAFPLILFIQIFRMSYIINVSNYSTQLQIITAPYLSENERLLYASKFAQVTSRLEYVELITKLQLIAKSHNINPPNLNIY